MRHKNKELIREENRTVIPFINMFYGVVITSLLFIIIGLLAKLNIIPCEEYNFKNLDSAGLALFVGGFFTIGLGIIMIANEEEKEEKEIESNK